jgi:hypothetical protein
MRNTKENATTRKDERLGTPKKKTGVPNKGTSKANKTGKTK